MILQDDSLTPQPVFLLNCDDDERTRKIRIIGQSGYHGLTTTEFSLIMTFVDCLVYVWDDHLDALNSVFGALLELSAGPFQQGILFGACM